MRQDKVRQEGNVRMEAEVREEKRCYTVGFEDGERATSQGMLAASRSRESKEMDSPLDPAEGTQSAGMTLVTETESGLLTSGTVR